MGHWDAWRHPSDPCYLKHVFRTLEADNPWTPRHRCSISCVLPGNMGHWNAWSDPLGSPEAPQGSQERPKWVPKGWGQRGGRWVG